MKHLLAILVTLALLMFAHLGLAKVSQDPRIKIAILDTGISITKKLKPFLCKGKHLTFFKNDSPFVDENGHGTNIAGIIADYMNPKTHCILSVKVFKGIYRVSSRINLLLKQNVQFINLSMAGTQWINLEHQFLKRAIAQGIKVSVAAGNRDNKTRKPANLSLKCKIYPACYPLNPKYFHVVASNTGEYSNFGGPAKWLEDGSEKGEPALSGSSQATAVHTGKWMIEKVGDL